MKKLTINIGFITNSSSVVHWFPREVLEDPDVKAFLSSYEISGGYVGDNLWYRSSCGSLVLTKDQRLEMNDKMSEMSEYSVGPKADPDDDSVVVIYGDEHPEISYRLCIILSGACARLGLAAGSKTPYN